MSVLLVAVFGVVVVVGLAVVVGRLEASAQQTAWRAIAEQRRALSQREQDVREARRELLDWEDALVEESERRERRGGITGSASPG